jgi:S-adenosylmethionine uptake transporter
MARRGYSRWMGPSPASHSPLAPFLVLGLGVAVFSAMDAVMKGLTIVLGAYNAVFWRLLIAAPIGALLYFPVLRKWPSRLTLKRHMLRGAVNAGSAVAFFFGLARMPIAEAITLSFVAPIMAVYLAAILLGEQIGRRAVFASLLSFCGVLVIVWARLDHPAGDWSIWGVIAVLGGALLYAYNLILLRQQALVAGPFEVAFFQTFATVLCLMLFTPFLAAVPPAGEVPALFGSALLTIIAALLFAWAYGRAEAQLLATLEYTALLWAALFGYLVFDEHVAMTTVCGAVLIVGGCVLAARTGRQPMSPAESPI